MATESSANPEASPAPQGLAPLSPAARKRLQQLYEHASRSVEKNDYDYANDLFTQCVGGDPGNLVYLQGLLANLQKKYSNNKKGSKLAGLKTSGAKKAIKAATGKEDWRAVIQAGCEVLKFHPWDTAALLTMSHACREMEIDECQLYYLRWALNAHPKDVEVNRRAAQALGRMGQFDQAIVCWHRVEEVKPGDEETAKEISRLTVEKTIQQGGYSREAILSLGEQGGESASGIARRTSAKAEAPEEPQPPQKPPKPPEQRLREAIEADPTDVANYLELADRYLLQDHFGEAEQVLSQALAATGGGDLRVRERIEDVQLRRARHQLEIAERRAAEEKTKAAQELAVRMRTEINQRELENLAARSERDPQNTTLRFELGLRLKRAGKFPEAIQSLQAARDDSRRRPQVFLELGECFQKIEQYKLAMTNYEASLEAAGDQQLDLKKLALYRAGVLATGLRDVDQAEKHLTDLAGIDFGYRDVAARLDKINRLRNKE